MSIIGSNILAGSSGQAGYNLNNSLRFRSSASAYLSRTLTTPTNSYIWTYSAWFKRGTLGVAQTLLEAWAANNNTQYGAITITSSDTLTVSGWTLAWRTTTQVFRDPSAWYHVVIAIDTTQVTAANRIKVYINGNQVTAFGTSNDPTQNTTTGINTAIAHSIGSEYSGTRYQYFDGYMTEVNFVDGTALTPSSFGETSTTTGSWIPKKYTSTYGTNGFYLQFADTSALTTTSNAGLGKDTSGNGNYWATSGISITAGTTYDAMLDVPTNTSATVANYAVWNPLQVTSYITLSEANLKSYGNTSSDNGLVFSTIGVSSGKWYYEYTCGSANNAYPRLGIGTTFAGNGNIPGSTSVGGVSYLSNGIIYYNNTNVTTVATYTAADVIGIAYDLDNLTVKFYKNNSLLYTFTSLPAGTYFAAIAEYNFSYGYINFGQRPFTYTPPSGYVALNTFNL